MPVLLRAGGKTLVVAIVLLLTSSACSLYVASRVGQPAQVAPPAPAGDAAPPAAAPAAPAQVPSVAHPEAIAAQRLGELPGGNCQAQAHVMLMPLADLDRRVIEAGGPGHWLETDIWIGDVDSAATAFAATWAARSSENPLEAWVETKRDGRTVALQLLAVKTTDGTEVWRTAGSIGLATCDPNG